MLRGGFQRDLRAAKNKSCNGLSSVQQLAMFSISLLRFQISVVKWKVSLSVESMQHPQVPSYSVLQAIREWSKNPDSHLDLYPLRLHGFIPSFIGPCLLTQSMFIFSFYTTRPMTSTRFIILFNSNTTLTFSFLWGQLQAGLSSHLVVKGWRLFAKPNQQLTLRASFCPHSW